MNFLDAKFFLGLVIYAPAILLALSFHELSHALVARKLGDPTAERAGRITLNPLAHLDPIGTIMIFIFHFGWAKPVPVNPSYFKNPRRDMLLVALAGPVSNLIMGVGFGLVSMLITNVLGMGGSIIHQMVIAGIAINAILMAFNMIPIPPLDGSKVMFGLFNFSPEFQYNYSRIGPMVLLGVILFGRFTGVSLISMFISPVINVFYNIFVY